MPQMTVNMTLDEGDPASPSYSPTLTTDIQEGDNVDVIYLDFAKAFDKVDHGILLHKLQTWRAREIATQLPIQ